MDEKKDLILNIAEEKSILAFIRTFPWYQGWFLEMVVLIN